MQCAKNGQPLYLCNNWRSCPAQVDAALKLVSASQDVNVDVLRQMSKCAKSAWILICCTNMRQIRWLCSRSSSVQHQSTRYALSFRNPRDVTHRCAVRVSHKSLKGGVQPRGLDCVTISIARGMSPVSQLFGTSINVTLILLDPSKILSGPWCSP